MQEYNVIIEIDEDGNIQAETKGMKGDICISELDEILKGFEGEQSFKNKPEFYQKNKNEKNIYVKY
ncbi:MAG: DUF2997 domain-containing protein [Campylobacteraceae bacterium]|nr:DUF2997 domain-containing protein [Campylobacteraceae bacterium]